MKTSEQIDQIAAALAQAQGEIQPAPKDSVNPHFKSHYADLAACWHAARGPLAKFSLSVSQDVITDFQNGNVHVVSKLMHKSGQWIENETACKPRALGPQDIGSAGTYLKRYGFCALVGVVADEDDDGNQASAKPDKGRLQEKKAERHAEAAAAASLKVTAPRSAGTFTGTQEQEQIVAAILEKRGVPVDFWEEIRNTLMGKKSTELDAVIEAVRKGAQNQSFQTDLDSTF